MVELYPDISDEIRTLAERAWKIALTQNTPIDMAEFLNIITEYYANTFTEEEVNFLRFYFNLQLERYKND